MQIKRLTEHLHITVEYEPNGHFEKDDDWELHIKVNDSDTHTITPFACQLKDLTINELLKEIKDVLKEELE